MVGGVLALLGGRAGAELEPLHYVDVSTDERHFAERLSTLAKSALARRDYRAALGFADRGLRADPDDAWLHYDRGVALFGLRRVDDALAELDLAETKLPARDTWGRSVVIYQRAIKLQQAGYCREARAAFGRYVALVGAVDVRAARVAIRAAAACPSSSLAARAAPAATIDEDER